MIKIATVTTHPDFYAVFESTARDAKTKSVCFGEINVDVLTEFDIVVIDLDSIRETAIKEKISSLQNGVIYGYARQKGMRDSFSAFLKPLDKPVTVSHLRTMIADCVVYRAEKNKVNSGVDEEIDSLLDPSILSDRERTARFKKIVQKYYDGLDENQFFESIGIGDLPRTASKDSGIEIVVEHRSKKVDLSTQFVNDALNLYRARKLKQMRLSVADIEKKMQEMLGNDTKRHSSDMIDSDRIMQELGSSQKLSFIRDNQTNNLPQQTQHPNIDNEMQEVQRQRQEVIEAERQKFVADSTERYGEKAAKYIKQPTAPQAHVANTDKPTLRPMSQAELSDRLRNAMSEEQFERLRKLGVKI